MKTEKKWEHLGMKAKVLLDLHLEKPKEFDAVRILGDLFDEYENLGFGEEMEIEPIMKEKDYKMQTATNVNRALYDIREGGECKVDDMMIRDLVTDELDQMDIQYIVTKDENCYVITQSTESEEMEC